MKDRIKDYFAFNSKEQRGLIVLLGILMLSASARIFLPYLVPEKEFDISPFRQEVEQFLASAEIMDSLSEKQSQKFQKEPVPVADDVIEAFVAAPFYFNPNELKKEDWIAMGMDERVTGNIIRYREKGGKFRDKEGFRKIYGMDDRVFAILEPYLVFEKKEAGVHITKFIDDTIKKEFSFENRSDGDVADTARIDLNSADSASLLALKGIGPSYAGRIIRYRDRLGGFYRTDQLLEIKGMDSIRLSQFIDQVIIDPLMVRKTNLNTVTFKDLLKHPYFEYYLVKAIFQKKDEIRKFDSVEQLKSIPVMYEELYEKIAPYLDVSP